MATDKADLLPQRKDAVRRAAPRSWVSRVGLFLLRSREASIAIAGIVLIIYFQSTAPAFLTPSNIGNLAEYTAMTAIIAAGLVMVLIAGEVDLSVGQVYALSPFVMHFAQQAGVPFVPAIGIGLVAAAIVGIINGFFTVMTPNTLFHHHSRDAVLYKRLHANHLGRFSRATESGAGASGNLRWQPGLADPVGDRRDAHSPVRARQDTLGPTHSGHRR